MENGFCSWKEGISNYAHLVAEKCNSTHIGSADGCTPDGGAGKGHYRERDNLRAQGQRFAYQEEAGSGSVHCAKWARGDRNGYTVLGL